MMLCQIFVFATHDLDLGAEFPHEFSAFADDAPSVYYRPKGDLRRQRFDTMDEVRTVMTEGLRSPVHSFSRADPPKYPPHHLVGYRCDHSIIAAVENHAQIVVYSIDTVDPDDYDSLPAAMKDMRPDDPIKDAVWTSARDGLVAVTPEGDQRDQVAVWLDGLREDHPDGMATQFAIAVRTFTS